MKKTVLAAFGALLSVVSLHSCLDFDMPTDTFTGGDTELDAIVYCIRNGCGGHMRP